MFLPPYSSERARRFGRTYGLISRTVELRKEETSRNRREGELSLSLAFDWFLDLLFYPEGGGDMFLRNIELSPNYVAIKPRKTNCFQYQV
jgi:hypothetical protein